MLTVTKSFEFSACHRLFRSDWSAERNAEVFGKCANPNGHGHNYRLEVSVTGPVEEETGMILDTNRLQRIVEEAVIQDVDHKNLNLDVDWLVGKMTSMEVLLEVFWTRLDTAIAQEAPSVRLCRLTLRETARNFATKEVR
jgi:6-pyruvoyltetrahydropterin/6-carboxytetrahydropterin synthase